MNPGDLLTCKSALISSISYSSVGNLTIVERLREPRNLSEGWFCKTVWELKLKPFMGGQGVLPQLLAFWFYNIK